MEVIRDDDGLSTDVKEPLPRINMRDELPRYARSMLAAALIAGGRPQDAAVLLDTWAQLDREDLRAGEDTVRAWTAVAALVRSKADGFITENTFRINVSITFNERWFMKWKFK